MTGGYKQSCGSCDGAEFTAAANYCPWCGAQVAREYEAPAIDELGSFDDLVQDAHGGDLAGSEPIRRGDLE